jgi:hypothetical protein
MKRKFYIAISPDPSSSKAVFARYCEIRENLSYFFGLPKYTENVLPNIIIVPPLTALVSDIGNLYLLLLQDKKLPEDHALWLSDFITLGNEGKSFGWKFSTTQRTEKVIEKVYEILKQCHIITNKTLDEILETLHLTLIEEIADTVLFKKGERYIDQHFPNATGTRQKLIQGTLKIFIEEENQWKEWLVVKPEKTHS